MDFAITPTVTQDLGQILGGITTSAAAHAWLALSAWVVAALVLVANWINPLQWVPSTSTWRPVLVYLFAAASAYAAAAAIPGSSIVGIGAVVLGAVSALARTPTAYVAIERAFDA
jgi:hypothetical protein